MEVGLERLWLLASAVLPQSHARARRPHALDIALAFSLCHVLDRIFRLVPRIRQHRFVHGRTHGRLVDRVNARIPLGAAHARDAGSLLLRLFPQLLLTARQHH